MRLFAAGDPPPPQGVSFTLRAPAESLLVGATLQNILLAEGSAVSSTDILAVLTITMLESEGAIATLGTGTQGDAAYAGELGVDLVTTSSSLVRDFLFEQFPRFRRYYFQTYPLLLLLGLAFFTTVITVGAVWMNRQFAQLSGTPAAPEHAAWSFFTVLAALLPIAVGILAALALLALRKFLVRRLSHLPRYTQPGGSKR